MLSQTIYKEFLKWNEVNKLEIRCVKILDIQLQNGVPTLWYVHDDCEVVKNVHIKIHGTGQEINEESGEYISTVIDGKYVWHFFAYIR